MRTKAVKPAILLGIVITLGIPGISPAQASDFEPVAPRTGSARLAGFGGAYTALEAGFDTLSTNPAALAYVSKAWSIARIDSTASGPIFDLPSVFKSDDVTIAMLDLVTENNGLYFSGDITGPLAFGKVDHNFGFGIFNRTITIADIPSISYARLLVGEEFLMLGGYGLTVYKTEDYELSLGLQLKGFFQVFVAESGSAVSVINTLTDADLDGLPSVLSTGFGLDAGFLFKYRDNFTGGIVCRDLFTPVFTNYYDSISDFLDGSSSSDTDYDRLSPDLSVGIVYEIPVPDRWTTITGWKVMADYRDILSFFDPLYRNPVLNFAAGTELELIDVVSVRLGLHETYLAAGIGLDATVCVIDFAMYGSELGLEPGRQPVLNIAFSLSFEL